MVAGAVLLHILILLPFGFLPAGIVLFWMVAVAMGEKRIWRAGAIAVAITVITYVGFVFGLQLPLPIGSVFESLGVSIG
jgi:putative tricarboxylic transport membrane protein